jgi:hypothetical protein
LGGRRLRGVSVGRNKLPTKILTAGSEESDPKQPPNFCYCPSVKGKSRAKKPKSSRNRNKPLSLKIWLHILVGDQILTVRALIDKGAEVNIIKKGKYPPAT